MLTVDPRNNYFEPLKEVGGSVEMNVNGAVTAKEFYIEVPANREVALHRVNLIIVDGGMDEGLFAGIVGGALTNGVNIKIEDDNGDTIKDYTTGFGNIKLNPDWNLLSGVDGVLQISAGDDLLPVRWTLARSGAAPLLSAGYRFVVTIQDDLSSITRFRGLVQGVLL